MQPLVAGPRSHLSEAEVAATLRLEHAPRVRHGVTVLDSRDQPTGEAASVDWSSGGQIRWDYRVPDDEGQPGGDAQAVRRTGSLTLVGAAPTFNLLASRLLVWTELSSPAGNWVRFHLGVMVPKTPGLRDDGLLVTRALELADKTTVYATRVLREPLVIPAGTAAVEWVRQRLGVVFGESRFAFHASTAALVEDKVFEQGMSELQVMNAVLQAVGYDQLVVDEDGRPGARPLRALATLAPEHTYEPGTTIVTAGEVEPLLPTLPNVLWFVARQGPSLPELGNGIAERRNTLTGPGSIQARGVESFQRVDVEAESQEALDAVADAQAQRYFAGGGLRFDGRVGLNPRHSDSDVIALTKPRLGLVGGTWLLTSWTYPLGSMKSAEDALMSITCEQRVV